MPIPSVISRNPYIAHLQALAWNAAGWSATVAKNGDMEAFGPASIRQSIDLDVLDFTGCIDAPVEGIEIAASLGCNQLWRTARFAPPSGA